MKKIDTIRDTLVHAARRDPDNWSDYYLALEYLGDIERAFLKASELEILVEK